MTSVVMDMTYICMDVTDIRHECHRHNISFVMDVAYKQLMSYV